MLNFSLKSQLFSIYLCQMDYKILSLFLMISFYLQGSKTTIYFCQYCQCLLDNVYLLFLGGCCGHIFFKLNLTPKKVNLRKVNHFCSVIMEPN